ncbi:DUF4411 family protein [Listeria monocytogenes]|nr:DUF4411 family protein [Listeria monocytogenes]
MDKKYILDSNTFIASYKQFYQFETFPSYWKKLSQVTKNSVILLDCIFNELSKTGKKDEEMDVLDFWLRDDYLGNRIKESQRQDILQKYAEILQHVASSPFYNEKALRSWSNPSIADPWLIATACCEGIVIVTNKVSNGKLHAGSPTGAVKIPDIAKVFGVNTISLFDFQKTFKFRF